MSMDSQTSTATAEGKRTQFSWFAYEDLEEGVAIAVCLELGFLVNRTTLQEAVAEILDLTDDYIGQFEDSDGGVILRPVPVDAWVFHLLKFAQQCSDNPEKRNTSWDCGIVQ